MDQCDACIIAKSSFSDLRVFNNQLSVSSEILLDKVIKLDMQQEKLSENQTQLENLNADLMIKNRELERFTSIASHHLQEPLRTIGNMTQLIRRSITITLMNKGRKYWNMLILPPIG